MTPDKELAAVVAEMRTLDDGFMSAARVNRWADRLSAIATRLAAAGSDVGCKEAFDRWCDKEGRYAALEGDSWTVWQAAWNARRSPDARGDLDPEDARILLELFEAIGYEPNGKLAGPVKKLRALKDRRP
jgi:hypothetical protein